MAKSKLSPEALNALIASYQNQQSQLEYQMAQNAAILADLEKDLKNQPASAYKASTAPKKGPGRPAGSSSTGKKRGRPAGSGAGPKRKPGRPACSGTVAKKRGRPAKVKTASSDVSIAVPAAEKTAASSAPKKRGRKPGPAKASANTTTAPKKRGRPAKVTTKAAASTKPAVKAKSSTAKTAAVKPAAKKRGRPAGSVKSKAAQKKN